MDPFSQADSSTTRRFGGTGLGLAISRQLVDLMGGEFDYTSEPGEGATFWFEVDLPATSPTRPASGSDSDFPTARITARPGARILLVDDSELNLEVGSGLLESAGFKVEIAVNGEEAVEAVKKGRYDVVLMDCLMPVMDGYEAARAIRAYERDGRRTPIIAVTAAAMKSDRERSIQSGMDDYLSKPLDLNLLISTLERWVPASDRGTDVGTSESEVPVSTQPDDGGAGPDQPPGALQELAELLPAEAFAHICERFLAATPLALDSLREAVSTGDDPATKARAHKLRGSMATLGFTGMSNLAAILEEGSGDRAAFSEVVEKMVCQFQTAKLHVESLTSEESTPPA